MLTLDYLIKHMVISDQEVKIEFLLKGVDDDGLTLQGSALAIQELVSPKALQAEVLAFEAEDSVLSLVTKMQRRTGDEG